MRSSNNPLFYLLLIVMVYSCEKTETVFTGCLQPTGSPFEICFDSNLKLSAKVAESFSTPIGKFSVSVSASSINTSISKKNGQIIIIHHKNNKFVYSVPNGARIEIIGIGKTKIEYENDDKDFFEITVGDKSNFKVIYSRATSTEDGGWVDKPEIELSRLASISDNDASSLQIFLGLNFGDDETAVVKVLGKPTRSSTGEIYHYGSKKTLNLEYSASNDKNYINVNLHFVENRLKDVFVFRQDKPDDTPHGKYTNGIFYEIVNKKIFDEMIELKPTTIQSKITGLIEKPSRYKSSRIFCLKQGLQNDGWYREYTGFTFNVKWNKIHAIRICGETAMPCCDIDCKN